MEYLKLETKMLLESATQDLCCALRNGRKGLKEKLLEQELISIENFVAFI